jgi:hypothetical protein
MWSHYEGALQNHDFVFDFIRRGSSLPRRYAFCHRHPFGRHAQTDVILSVGLPRRAQQSPDGSGKWASVMQNASTNEQKEAGMQNLASIYYHPPLRR